MIRVIVSAVGEEEMGMAATGVGESSSKPSAAKAILWGGLIVGGLDLVYAIVVYTPRHPILIPQTIASGLLGVKSYDDGVASAFLGIVLQFVIATTAAAVYYAASRKMMFLVTRAVLYGMLYGAVVYLFMHRVVVPLSAVPKHTTPLPYAAAEFVEHWFFVGLPIALSVRRFGGRAGKAQLQPAAAETQ